MGNNRHSDIELIWVVAQEVLMLREHFIGKKFLCLFDYCSHISVGCNCSPCHTDVDLSGKNAWETFLHDLNLVGSEFENLLSKLAIFSKEHIWPNFAKLWHCVQNNLSKTINNCNVQCACISGQLQTICGKVKLLVIQENKKRAMNQMKTNPHL